MTRKEERARPKEGWTGEGATGKTQPPEVGDSKQGRRGRSEGEAGETGYVLTGGRNSQKEAALRHRIGMAAITRIEAGEAAGEDG